MSWCRLRPPEAVERSLVPVLGIEPWMAALRERLAGGACPVHEVAVGPVHAGVIEPGHFRFQSYGEQILHLEIMLGYQRRGVETLLPQRNTAQ